MKIWIDVSSGTYGAADDLVFVDVSDWSNEEIEALHEMNDDDRSAFGYQLSELQGEEE